MALVLTVTFHVSFAYSANALSAASWMNFETGVISVSSPSIGACAAAGAASPSTIAASTSSVRRRMDPLLVVPLPSVPSLRAVRDDPARTDRRANAATIARGGEHRDGGVAALAPVPHTVSRTSLR